MDGKLSSADVSALFTSLRVLNDNVNEMQRSQNEWHRAQAERSRLLDKRLVGFEERLQRVEHVAKNAKEEAGRASLSGEGFEANIQAELIHIKQEVADAVSIALRPSKKERNQRRMWRVLQPTITAILLAILYRFGVLPPQNTPREMPPAPYSSSHR